MQKYIKTLQVFVFRHVLTLALGVGVWIRRLERPPQAPEARALNGVAQEDEMAEDEIEVEEEKEEEKLVVCQRCHKLRFYGSVTESLRPGFSDSDLLTPKRFLVSTQCVLHSELLFFSLLLYSSVVKVRVCFTWEREEGGVPVRILF